MSTPGEFYRSLPPMSNSYGVACLMTTGALTLIFTFQTPQHSILKMSSYVSRSGGLSPTSSPLHHFHYFLPSCSCQCKKFTLSI
ncbi:hypothetical protein SLE2022_022230 [Rubroshorea leprosula]